VQVSPAASESAIVPCFPGRHRRPGDGVTARGRRSFFPEKGHLGDDTIVGRGTKLLTHEPYTDEWHVGPIDIGDDVAVGHSCSLRPGVTTGDGATVAAHSSVNRDSEPGETVGGVPTQTISTD